MIFLLPHAGGSHHENKHGDHAAPQSHAPTPLQQQRDPVEASQRQSFTTASPDDGVDPQDLQQLYQEFWELQSPDVPAPQHDEIVSPYCVVANVCGMLCVCLVPYCVNATVTWKGLPHAATFPVFCLGIVTVLYASTMFVVLRFIPGDDGTAREQARRSLWLLYATAALLCMLAIVTDGSWSIDAIVLVSP